MTEATSPAQVEMECGGCTETADIPAAATLPKLSDLALASGMAYCGHCEAWYHRVGCFSFHRADPVPFVSRAAERAEHRRLAYLDRMYRRIA